jgi:hypothetical protein
VDEDSQEVICDTGQTDSVDVTDTQDPVDQYQGPVYDVGAVFTATGTATGRWAVGGRWGTA